MFYSNEFERQGQWLKVKVSRDKNGKTAASSPLTMHCYACAVRNKGAAGDRTIPWPPGVTGWRECMLTAVYINLYSPTSG